MFYYFTLSGKDLDILNKFNSSFNLLKALKCQVTKDFGVWKIIKSLPTKLFGRGWGVGAEGEGERENLKQVPCPAQSPT